MARRKKRVTFIDKVISKIIAAFLLICIAVWAFSSYPAVSIVLTVLIIISFAFQVRRCELCGALLKRQSYTLEIGDKRKKICPKCNNNLENKRSREAIRNL